MVVHKAACHTLSKTSFEIGEDLVQILLMLEVLFTWNSKAEDMLFSALNPVFSSAIISPSSLRLKPDQDGFRMRLTFL